MTLFEIAEVVFFAVISFLDFPSWGNLRIVAVTTRRPYWQDAFRKVLRSLMARDINRLLVGTKSNLFFNVRYVNELYAAQFGRNLEADAGASVYQIISENPTLLTASPSNTGVRASVFLVTLILLQCSGRTTYLDT